ncbi:MAG: serine hydrolase domain-containing protein [Pyrinomonadaceae bacterium]
MKNQISEFLQSKIDEKYFPSAVYLVAEKGEIVLEDAIGFAVVDPEKIEAKPDTIYDLASLTKVLVTGLIVAKELENGAFSLDDKIAKFVAEFELEDKKRITILDLLTHISGFKDWIPFYLASNADSNISEMIVNEPLANPVRSTVVYSDLNFLLLGTLIEKLSGSSLDMAAKRFILDPLKLENTFFNPPDSLKTKIAASEKGNEYERKTCLDLGYEVERSRSVFREQVIWGEVHDNNCWHFGGVSAHAGLFSNVRDVFEIARQFLPETTTILKPETCELFRTNFTPGMNQARSLAFQLAETNDSTAGEALSKDSFGHLGFTGTSLWIDPQKQRIYILLTNRTHDRALPFADLKETRQNFHSIASKMLDERSKGS